eukprot:TRINITY_DN192_c1_g1_i2.p2 TRINITY_DN192_c1_g1~~TRINITY_DN192_c1_g1_i2.p2  ORF type:complete len:310 (+),score=73.30 TRINITY_DN192_c1_g1_i2:74-931(+)
MPVTVAAGRAANPPPRPGPQRPPSPAARPGDGGSPDQAAPAGAPAAAAAPATPRGDSGGAAGAAPGRPRRAALGRERQAQRQQLIRWLEQHAVLRARVAALEREAAAAAAACPCCRAAAPASPAPEELQREWREAVTQQARLSQTLRRCAQLLREGALRSGADALSGARKTLMDVDRRLVARQRHHAGELQALADEEAALTGALDTARASVAAIAAEAGAAAEAAAVCLLRPARQAPGAGRRSASCPPRPAPAPAPAPSPVRAARPRGSAGRVRLGGGGRGKGRA